MPDNSGKTEDNIWPLPKFYFQVSWDSGMKTAFQEVAGLETETQSIEYKRSNSKQFSTIKMPGIAKYGNVTLKRGIFVKDNTFWKWYDEIQMNTVKRETVIIQLLNENGEATMQWTLKNAWPTKIQGRDLKSDGNEVAIDTIEIAYEGLTIANPASGS